MTFFLILELESWLFDQRVLIEEIVYICYVRNFSAPHGSQFLRLGFAEKVELYIRIIQPFVLCKIAKSTARKIVSAQPSSMKLL